MDNPDLRPLLTSLREYIKSYNRYNSGHPTKYQARIKFDMWKDRVIDNLKEPKVKRVIDASMADASQKVEGTIQEIVGKENPNDDPRLVVEGSLANRFGVSRAQFGRVLDKALSSKENDTYEELVDAIFEQLVNNTDELIVQFEEAHAKGVLKSEEKAAQKGHGGEKSKRRRDVTLGVYSSAASVGMLALNVALGPASYPVSFALAGGFGFNAGRDFIGTKF